MDDIQAGAVARRPRIRRGRVAGLGLATIAMSVGLAAPASAASLGTITNYAPGYVFKSSVPKWAEVESTVREGALNGCRTYYAATKSVRLISYTQDGAGGMVTSKWDCRN